MSDLKLCLDRCEFPMVWVDELAAYVHLYPVLKIQFEYFLCASTESYFDAAWYDNVLQLNPRITPGGIREDNYYRAVLSGVLPDEAQRFARWCGDEYSIPTLKEWLIAYRALRSRSPVSISTLLGTDRPKERTRLLMERLDQASSRVVARAKYERTFADQMLMRMGVMEWVECPERRTRWGGMGETPPGLYGMLFTPESGQPHLPTNPEAERLLYYGFRLLRRGK